MKIYFIISAILFVYNCSAKFLPRSFHAKIEQVTKSVLSEKKKISYGKMDYLSPGHLRFEILKPVPLILVSNPRTTWKYQPPFNPKGAGQLVILKTKDSMITHFFDALKYGLKSNLLYKVKVTKNTALINFVLSEIDKIGVKKALLIFESNLSFKNLKKLEITKSNNQKFSLNFKKIDFAKKLGPQNFIFKAPANTRISRP